MNINNKSLTDRILQDAKRSIKEDLTHENKVLKYFYNYGYLDRKYYEGSGDIKKINYLKEAIVKLKQDKNLKYTELENIISLNISINKQSNSEKVISHLIKLNFLSPLIKVVTNPKEKNNLLEKARAKFIQKEMHDEEIRRVDEAEAQLKSKEHDLFANIICYKTYPRYQKNIDLTSDDLRLISEWVKLPASTINKIQSKEDIYKEAKVEKKSSIANVTNNVTQMISARCAEKVAIEFYNKIRGDSVDYSIQQVSKILRNSKWKLCDIKSGKFLIDVKNARRSFSNPATYSEQFIKNFKSDDYQRPVNYLGTLSKYKTEAQEKDSNDVDVNILGEVNHEDIKHLEDWVNTSFNTSLQIDLSRIRKENTRQKGNFIPGSMFEYPLEFYPDDHEIESKFEKLKEWKESNNVSKNIKIPLRIMAEKSLEIDKEDIPKTDYILITKIINMKASIGITRRSIYLLILAFTIESLDAEYKYKPDMWRKILFYNDNYNNPLGLFDPERYVITLIEVLEALWEKEKGTLSKYNSFKLSGPNILKGMKSGSKPETVIAYCGGWINDGINSKKPCGRSPLYLGNSELCNYCSYLICPDKACNTCKENCERNTAYLNNNKRKN